MLVPDVTNLVPREAFASLRRSGLQPVLLGVPTVKSSGDVGYYVAAQEPGGGAEAEAGSRVVLALDLSSSTGTVEGPPVAAPGTPTPSVVGVELEEAMSLVARDGLIAVVCQPRRAVEQLEIARQEPTAGQPVERFLEVVLLLD